MNDTSINQAKDITRRISAMKNLTNIEKAELFKELVAHYDEKIDRDQATYESNSRGGEASAVNKIENNGEKQKRERLVNMYFDMQQRHGNYEEEKKSYTPEQLAMVEKMEKETGGKIKFVVDTNFLKAFNKIMGVDYRGAGVFGNLVVVGDAKHLTDESLLRHEIIHCVQQQDMGILLGIPVGNIVSAFAGGTAGQEVRNHIGMTRWILLSFASKNLKQLLGKERFTPSAVDYGTDNQATDLETYMKQFDPTYIPKRSTFEHLKYYLPRILKREYKQARDEELKVMKEKLASLEQRGKEGKVLSLHEMDTLKKLEKDIIQFEKMLKHIENDKESRVVLIESDVLPSKKDKDSSDYDERAQVWTESRTNLNKRLKTEKSLYRKYEKKLEEKKEELENNEGNEEIEKEIDTYEKLLAAIKGNKDKSRRKSRQDKKGQQLENAGISLNGYSYDDIEKFMKNYNKKSRDYKQGIKYYTEYRKLLDEFNQTTTLGRDDKEIIKNKLFDYVKIHGPEKMRKFFEDNKVFFDEHRITESED